MLQFSYGATRFVVFVGPFVVKIARIRVFWAFSRLFIHVKNGEVGAKATREVSNPRGAVAKVFSGIDANHREHTMWAHSRHPALVPTLFSLLAIVNIQPRGTPVTAGELWEEGPFGSRVRAPRAGEPYDDLNNPANYCRYRGRVLMCDYGHEDMEVFVPKPETKLVFAK